MIYQGDAKEYIYNTPGILSEILKNEDAILKESIGFLKKRKISEVWITGSGSSYNAAASIAAFAKKTLGIRVTPVYPVMLIEDCKFLSKDAVVLGISQQGTSMAVIEALDKVRKRGITGISVTGEYDTEIIRHSDRNIYVECGYEDAGATTKGYTATVLTLFLFVLQLGRAAGKISDCQFVSYKERLKKIIENMDRVLKTCENWCQETAEKLKRSRDMVIITANTLQGALLEGTLKFSETCRFPVRGYEAEEFMHGVYNAVTKETDFLYLFPADGYELKRMERLFEYYERQGYHQYALNWNGNPNAYGGIFLNDPDFSVLEYILPQQMLFVLTSRKRNIDLNIPKDPDFHKYMGSKLEK